MISENTLIIIPFSSNFKEAIKILNFEWLNKYFRIGGLENGIYERADIKMQKIIS